MVLNMRGRFGKSIMATLLIGTLVVGGCSKNGENGKGTESTPSATGATATKGSSVTLTYSTYDVPSDSIDNFVDTPVGQQILKELNIIVKIRGSQNIDRDIRHLVIPSCGRS